MTLCESCALYVEPRYQCSAVFNVLIISSPIQGDRTVAFCEEHAKLYSEYLAADLPEFDHEKELARIDHDKAPFVLTISCEHNIMTTPWYSILELSYVIDEFADDDHYRVTVTMEDSSGRILQLYPL